MSSARMVPFAVMAMFASPVVAQTIQLPTFQNTSVATTVSVPVGGGVNLGGVSRSSSTANRAGTPLAGRLPFAGRPFGNRAFGNQRLAGNMSVHVQVHDFEAMDRALLAEAARRRQQRGAHAAAGNRIVMRVNDGGRLVGESTAATSVHEIRRQQAVEQAQQDEELADLWQRAQAAEAKGKPHVAKIFYRMILRTATGDLRAQTAVKMAAVSRK